MYKPWSQCLGYNDSDFCTLIDLSLDQLPCIVTKEKVCTWLGNKKEKTYCTQGLKKKATSWSIWKWVSEAIRGRRSAADSIPLPTRAARQQSSRECIGNPWWFTSQMEERISPHRLLYYWHMIDVPMLNVAEYVDHASWEYSSDSSDLTSTLS